MFILAHKKCITCKKEKTIDCFYYRKDNKKYKSECKECTKKRSTKRNKDSGAKRAEYLREWYYKNILKENERSRLYRVNNPGKRKESIHNWYIRNKEKVLANVRKHRSKKKNNGGNITPQEWNDLKRKYQYTCLCCRKKEPEIKLELDHVIPSALGGRNSIENAQPLCRSCNAKKSAKIIDYR